MARLERDERQVTGVFDDRSDGDHDQDEELEAEEGAGDLRRDAYTSDHHRNRSHRQEHRQDSPGDVPPEVVVQREREEATRNRDDRCHRDDVARAGEESRRDGARRTEGLADEGDEPAGRRGDLRELRERVGEEGDRDARREDGERRGDAGGERKEAEAEKEGHRWCDIRHRRSRDVDEAEHAFVEAMLLADLADRWAL